MEKKLSNLSFSKLGLKVPTYFTNVIELQIFTRFVQFTGAYSIILITQPNLH
jgi:hypothetical protein